MALVVLSTRIPETVDESLKAVSEATGRTIAELTRTAFLDMFENKRDEFKRQAIELAAAREAKIKAANEKLDNLATQDMVDSEP